MDSDHLLHHLENPADAVAPYPSFYEGPRLGIDPSHDEDDVGQPRRERVHYDNDCTLWIGNVDLRISETMLFELFAQVGDVRNVTFPNKQSQHPDEERSSRFCFINFFVPDSVPKAIQMMQGTVLFGRKLFLKCRPGSIHALHMQQQPSKYLPQLEQLQKEESFRQDDTPSNWNSAGADSTSDLKRFSPIRAPSPQVSTSQSRGRRKVVLVRDSYAKFPDGGDSNFNSSPTSGQVGMSKGSRRRVIIKPSSGSVIPVINVNTDQKKIKSVVVTPQQSKSTTTRDEVNLESAGEGIKHSPQASSPVQEKNSSLRATESVTPAETGYSHPPAQAVVSNTNEQYSSSIEVVQAHHQQQFSGTTMRHWRPRVPGFQGYQPGGYNYNMSGMRPVFPHFNKYFRCNDGGRYPPVVPRYRSYPPPAVRPYGYDHCASYAPAFGYPVAPFRPRFPDSYSYQPRYENHQNYEHQHGPSPLSHPVESNSNYTYVDVEQDSHRKEHRAIPPAPPRIRSRSRTRSRSKSPRFRKYYRSTTPVDKFRRMKSRSRSRTPSIESHYKRRSESRGSSSSYSRGYRSSSVKRPEGRREQRRARRSRSESYSSTEEAKKLRSLRSSRPSGTANPTYRSTSSSDTSDYSLPHKNRSKSSGELSFSDNDDGKDKNDNTTVSSSNNAVKKRLKRSQKTANSGSNSQQGMKQGKGRKSRFIRTSVSSHRAEREYDPSDPGY